MMVMMSHLLLASTLHAFIPIPFMPMSQFSFSLFSCFCGAMGSLSFPPMPRFILLIQSVS